MLQRTLRYVVVVAAVLVGLLRPVAVAHAFCGFYVSGADSKLFNNATEVVLMRSGERTVMSMQNNYQGPPADFAMIVPVPVVLHKENVKTLPRDVFDRVDALTAPRLVEYWEQDPCAPMEEEERMMEATAAPPSEDKGEGNAPGLGVKIEAKFTVGEYEIVILSAKDSAGLDTWLRQEKYNIPAGAEPLLRPYVSAGMKFFVAKVNVKKVKFERGMATLSPLRFHFDSKEFRLPVRLGLVNSKGTQDLIVYVLSPGQRYEVANYPNATIPTNVDVRTTAKSQFGRFYASLYDKTVARHPKAVVTEYAWDSDSCDPCPTPPLDESELATLGADVLMPGLGGEDSSSSGARSAMPRPSSFVLTRLHARYSKESLGEDLVFRAAPPISGGREMRGADGKLEHGSKPAPVNNFQARYAIRHAWTGKVKCENPRRGIWGGPPAGGEPKPVAARDTAFAKRDLELASFVASAVPELAVEPKTPVPAPGQGESAAPGSKPEAKGCSRCNVAGSTPRAHRELWTLAIALGLIVARRRRRSRPVD